MEPEKEDGNIEYKLKLIGVSDHRVNELASQMRFRCDEGGSECIYNLGVADNGEEVGITAEEFEETISALNSAADKNNYSVKLLTTKEITPEKNTYEGLVREINENKYIDIKLAVAGSVDAGKSSTIGSLITGKNDDGRGAARTAVFNFRHELDSGRTSSVAHHIIGYDEPGEILNYKGPGHLTWPEIINRSCKVVSLYDLAGHEKYL